MKLKTIDKKLIIPMIIALLGFLLIIISMFLPYISGTQALKAEVDRDPNLYSSLSIFEYAKIHGQNSEYFFNNNEGYIYIGFMAAICVFSLIGFIFTLFKKPVIAIITSSLSLFVFGFQAFDFSFRGEINEFYTWGYGFYVYFIATVLVLAGAIWLIIVNKKSKKIPNQESLSL